MELMAEEHIHLTFDRDELVHSYRGPRVMPDGSVQIRDGDTIYRIDGQAYSAAVTKAMTEEHAAQTRKRHDTLFGSPIYFGHCPNDPYRYTNFGAGPFITTGDAPTVNETKPPKIEAAKIEALLAERARIIKDEQATNSLLESLTLLAGKGKERCREIEREIHKLTYASQPIHRGY